MGAMSLNQRQSSVSDYFNDSVSIWLTAGYLLVACAFAGFTWLEGYKAEARWDLLRVAGISASLVWPVLLLLVLVSLIIATFSRRSDLRLP